MPKVLFVVHGMGDYLPGWSKELIDQLDTSLAAYPGFAGQDRPLRDRVAIEEITYDAVFDKLIEPWGRQRAALEQFSRDHSITLDDTLTQLATNQLPHDVSDFMWETLLDPVLYRGSPIVRDNVRQSVARQFLAAWDRHLTSNTSTAQVEVSVLCHSQGTIVMSDVLAQIGEARLPEYRPFSAEKRTLSTLMTVANVSRLGPAKLIDIDSRQSCVRPLEAPAWKTGKQNYLRRFINVRHEFDPFCLWQRFVAPASWIKNYTDIPGIRHFHQANTHGYLHYLKNPRVHIPLFRTLLGNKSISAADANAAIAAFPDIEPASCSATINALRSALDALSKDVASPGRELDKLVANGLRVYQAIKKAGTDCAPLLRGTDAT